MNKIFNSTTISGRANVAKATYATIALLYLVNRRRRRKATSQAKDKDDANTPESPETEVYGGSCGCQSDNGGSVADAIPPTNPDCFKAPEPLPPPAKLPEPANPPKSNSGCPAAPEGDPDLSKKSGLYGSGPIVPVPPPESEKSTDKYERTPLNKPEERKRRSCVRRESMPGDPK